MVAVNVIPPPPSSLTVVPLAERETVGTVSSSVIETLVELADPITYEAMLIDEIVAVRVSFPS